MKQFFTLLFLSLCSMPLSARWLVKDKIYYGLNEERHTAEVVGESLGELTDLVIPEIITDGCVAYTVTSIGGSAFWHSDKLTSVSFPASLTSIGEYAFEGCSNLTSVRLPESLESIALRAFSGCSALTSVKFPSSLTSIGMSAFFGCSALESVSFPESLTSMGMSAFEGCSNLTSVNFPEFSSLTSIDGAAFRNCTSLTSVSFPASLRSIYESAFSACSALEAVRFPKSLKVLGDGSFSSCTSLKNIMVYSETPLEILNVFEGCYETATLFVPKGAKSAYEHAENWRSFLNIQEMDVAGVSSVSVRDLSKDGEYFNLRGMKVERPSAGVYLWRKGNKMRKVMLR